MHLALCSLGRTPDSPPPADHGEGDLEFIDVLWLPFVGSLVPRSSWGDGLGRLLGLSVSLPLSWRSKVEEEVLCYTIVFP